MSGLDILLFLIITISGYTDFKYRKIYNTVLFPALILALVYRLWVFGLPGLFSWGQGLALGLLFLLIPYLLGGMGAGDVKLLAAVGAIRGPAFVFYCFLATALIGGLMAVCLWNAQTALPPEDENTGLPYGLAIAGGAMITYLVI